MISSYLRASELERHAASAASVKKVAETCLLRGVSKIYLETFRHGHQLAPADLARVRDGLRAAGLEVHGAICTTGYGTPGDVLTGCPCLSRRKSLRALEHMAIIAAELFDTILLDEYIWSHCRCRTCRGLKKRRSWTEFRCDQLIEVCRDHVLRPARAKNPGVRMIFKFPAMYEQLARQGQDVGRLAAEFDGVCIGTEIGPFDESPQNTLRSQGPYRAFFLARWISEIAGPKASSAWVMPLADAGHFRDTVYQTVLAGVPEVVLHPYGGLATDYDWDLGGQGQFVSLLESYSALAKLSAIARDNPARGLAAILPPVAEPWDPGRAYDGNVFDYIGQIGVPLIPETGFSETLREDGHFLSLHVRTIPGHEEWVRRLSEAKAPFVLTDGLMRSLGVAGPGPGPNAVVVAASSHHPLLFDYRGEPDPYDLAHRLRPIPAERSWRALQNDIGWDSSMRYTGDPHMAAKVFGMSPGRSLDFGQSEPSHGAGGEAPNLDSLRRLALGPFGLSLRGPIRVSLQPLGDDWVALHNFNDFAVEMAVDSTRPVDLSLDLVLPDATSATVVRREGSRIDLRLNAHSLAGFRRSIVRS